MSICVQKKRIIEKNEVCAGLHFFGIFVLWAGRCTYGLSDFDIERRAFTSRRDFHVRICRVSATVCALPRDINI